MNRVVEPAFPFEGWLDPQHVAMADHEKMDFVLARNFEYTANMHRWWSGKKFANQFMEEAQRRFSKLHY
jgi:hypothetical protein